MKFSEHVVLAMLLTPTAAVATAIFISLAGAHSDMAAESGIQPTSLAVYYADLEHQP